jgi:predicted chitinase
MEPITEAELRRFAPSARPQYVTALVKGWPELQRAGINTPNRLVEFLAQTAHETGGYTIVREDTSWTSEQVCKLWPGRFKTQLDPRILACGKDPKKLANLAYSARDDLGNCGGDDGWRYRGGGYMQTTGRENYRRAGHAIGVALEENPEFIETADLSLKCALWEWSKAKCNALADRGYTRAIGNAINLGNAYSSKDPIGHESRLSWKARALAVFGDGSLPLSGLALGAHGSEVEVLQRRLKELNYGLGGIDSVYGPATARAVAAFKLDHKRASGESLEPDDVVGEKTWAALNVAQPVTYPERQTVTAAQLAEKGSTEVITGQRQKAAGHIAVAASAVEGTRQSGILDSAKEQLSILPEAHTFLVPVIEAVKWGFGNIFWVGTLLLGVWVWSGGAKTIAARVRAHVNGFNLFR